VEGQEVWIFTTAGLSPSVAQPWLQIHGVVEDPVGLATVHGVLQIGEGQTQTVLVAEGAGGTAACADTDGDGIAGLVALTVPFRDTRTGASVPVRITPSGAQDLDESGAYRLTVAFEERVVEIEVRFASRWVGTGPARR
jgi:hypothetical protein